MPIDMPPKEPHSNQVASTTITVLPRGNDTDLTASSAATAEIDDVFLVGGGVAILDGRRRPSGNCVGHRMCSEGANRDISTRHAAKQ